MGNLQVKEKLTEKQLQILASEYEGKKKSKTVLWLLWLFTGGIGGHRYYLGDIGHGIAMTLTLGGIGIWALIDAFFISKRLDQKNENIELELINLIH